MKSSLDACPFCQLISNGLPAHAIYEDERVFVMLDRSSVSFGHVMVIPKKHDEKIYEMGQDDYLNLLAISRRLARLLQETLQPKAVAYVAHGAGLPHVHLHLAPLSERDEIMNP